MNCIIIDDELTARTIINQLCSKAENVVVLEEFSNAIEAIKYLNKNEVDLIFLDVHMPGFTGFEFIETLKNPPKIILTTSDVNFAIEAFEYECIIDFLLKPITFPRFQKALNKVDNLVKQDSQTDNSAPQDSTNEIYVNIDRRLVKIATDSIYIIEAKGDYILIKTKGKDYMVHSTLKKIEDKLPKDSFLKIHRSFIINTTHIIDIEDNSVLIDKHVIPVSRSNRPELMKRLNLL